ncbi:MAG: four helix bundle protein [Psychroflexus halocasei]
MDYKELDAWKESMKLVKLVYEITQNFPDEEKYGLVSQLRRASVSIPSNIAEGCSRSSNKEYKRFVEIALGSILELETQLIIATELNFLQKENLIFDKIENTIKIINGLIRFLKKNS